MEIKTRGNIFPIGKNLNDWWYPMMIYLSIRNGNTDKIYKILKYTICI